MITPTVGHACATCGEAMLPGDLFCGHCGSPVTVGDQPARGPAFQPYPRPSTARRVLAAVLAFIVVAGISGLIVAVVDAHRDADEQRDRAAAAQSSVVALTAELEETTDPDDSLQQQLTAAQAQVADLEAQLTKSQNDLTAEREGRANDAVAARTQKEQAVAEVQTELDATAAELATAQADLAAMQAIFPISENTFRAAAPSAEYAVTIQPLECTIVACVQVRSLSLSFPDPTKVSGNRANGIIAFDAGSYVSRGTLSSEQSPLCNGVATAATFELTFHASQVAVAGGLLSMQQGLGTYRETIGEGDCAGQFRSYSVAMVKQ